jgi:hypothetical protein
MVMAANEIDRKFDENFLVTAKEFARANGMKMFRTSAYTGEGVTELFTDVARNSTIMSFCRILWRGSTNGFRAVDFDQQCDGHENTLTLIRDSKGNVFGGFTPIAWESPLFAKRKKDPTKQTVVFTAKNPHNSSERLFDLIERSSAIRVDRKRGPCFGDGDLWISDECNRQQSDSGRFGMSFLNDTGFDGSTFLTGHLHSL